MYAKIAVWKFLTFFIFAYDALNEPPHLDIAKEKGSQQRSAKIWLESLEIAEKGSLKEKKLNEALRIMKENQAALLDLFEKVKNGEKIKTLKFK